MTFLILQLGIPHIDLQVYRFAVDVWFGNGDIYGPLPMTDVDLELPYIYPPFAILPAIPLALMPMTAAFVVLFALNIVAIAGTLYLVGRRVWPEGGTRGAALIAAAGLSLSLTLEPVRDTFSFGQINLLLMGLVAADCLTRAPRWPRGLLIGIAAAIKLTPAVFVLFFLVRKDYRAAIVAGITGVAATALGFLTSFSASVEYWFGGLGDTARISGSTYRANQTVTAAFARFGIEKPLLTVLVAVVVLALLILVARTIRHSGPATALALVGTFLVLASPTSWSHHWVWIAPASVVMLAATTRAFGDGSRARWPLAAASGTTVLLFVIAPFHFLPGNHDWTVGVPDVELTWSPWEHLVGDLYILAGIAWIVGCAIALRPRTTNPRQQPQPVSARG
ncbi:glycosyltransferase family 87 protein [Haloechinothrix halophila]|uniref:glycosyltransferase family 87 protein n=1 Tax=Haloechinothrix halophila TaxID=1069073 RepID=UPI00146FB4DA|nr:glycosyltransferase family 87 protein [Haloechinothrix halophila]